MKSTHIPSILATCLFTAFLGFAVAMVGCDSDSDDNKDKCETKCDLDNPCENVVCECADGTNKNHSLCVNGCCASKETACKDACGSSGNGDDDDNNGTGGNGNNTCKNKCDLNNPCDTIVCECPNGTKKNHSKCVNSCCASEKDTCAEACAGDDNDECKKKCTGSESCPTVSCSCDNGKSVLATPTCVDDCCPTDKEACKEACSND